LNENCKLQFGQQFRRFCTQTRHLSGGNLKPGAGLEPVMAKVLRHARTQKWPY